MPHHRLAILLSLLGLLPVGCATTAASSAGGHGAAGWVRVEGPVEVGNTPDFQLPRVPASEGLLTLSELRGQVVIIDFWASWCAPCKEAMPFYADLQRRHPEGLVVLGINVDEDVRAMEAALREAAPGFAVLRDPAGETVAAFGVEAMPTSFVLDREGKVVLVHRGFVPSDRERLGQAIEQLLAP